MSNPDPNGRSGTKTRHCCFIPPEEQEAAQRGEKVPGCQIPAAYEIWCEVPNIPPDGAGCVTDACATHATEMLCDEHPHRVIPV